MRYLSHAWLEETRLRDKQEVGKVEVVEEVEKVVETASGTEVARQKAGWQCVWSWK